MITLHVDIKRFELAKQMELNSSKFKSFILNPKISAALRHMNEKGRLDNEGSCFFDLMYKWWVNYNETPLLVDFGTEEAWEHFDTGLSHYNSYNLVEQENINKVLKEAFNILRKIPAAFDLVSKETKILRFRKTPQDNRFGSSSNFLRIGDTFVRNLENTEHQKLELAEVLLHEAIHHLLAKDEMMYGMYLSQKDNSMDGIQSPWSNNTMHVNSFGQACFVWYGLWHFWNLIRYIIPEKDFAESRCNRAAMGFIGNDSLSSWIRHSNPIFRNEFVENLDKMQKTLKVQYE
ncbi:MAG: HEXXH motif-containing putative peptide modification protein [Chryseobacterium sp.]